MRQNWPPRWAPGEHSRKSIIAASKKLGMKDSEGYNVVYKYMTSGSKRGYFSFPFRRQCCF